MADDTGTLRFALRQGPLRGILHDPIVVDERVPTTALIPPAAARGATGRPLPRGSAARLAEIDYPAGRHASGQDGWTLLGDTLLAAFGLQRREPANPANDHRVVASVRSKFPVHVFVIPPDGPAGYLDLYRHALVDLAGVEVPAALRPAAGEATVVLAARHTDLPTPYGALRCALTDLETGINLRSLLIAAELAGLAAVVATGGPAVAAAAALVAATGPGSWSAPVTVTLRKVGTLPTTEALRPSLVVADDLLRSTPIDGSLAEIAEIVRLRLDNPEPPQSPANGIPQRPTPADSIAQRITPAIASAQRTIPASSSAQGPSHADNSAQSTTPADGIPLCPTPTRDRAQRPAPASDIAQRPTPAKSSVQRPTPADSGLERPARGGISWERVLWQRTSGRVRAPLTGFSARPAHRGEDFLADLTAWATVPAPTGPLREIGERVGLTVVLQNVGDRPTGRYDLRDPARTKAGVDPARIERCFGYPLGSANDCGVRHSLAVCLFTVDLHRLVADLGPSAWSLLQVWCGWVAHGLTMAAAGHGLFARPARSFDEHQLIAALGLGAGEVPVFMTLCGRTAYAEPMLDLRF